MKRSLRIALIAACLACAAGPLSAQRLTLKIASIAPENTPWGAGLNKMAAEWKEITNGELEVRIYHNGIAGSEADMLRKLKLGQIQGAVFTSFGLSAINREVLALSAPFLIRDNGELDYALAGVRPGLERKIEEQGFRTIAWSKAGWVRVFSKEPVFLPEQLKKQKLATDPNDMALLQAFKSLGYQMVPVPMGETLMALNSGMVDAVYASPLAVGGFQLFGVAKHMASFKLCPFLGGIVVSNATWRRVPDKYKAALESSNARLEKEIDAAILRMEDEAVAAMKGYGLTINELSAAQLETWRTDIAKGIPLTLGSSFDEATYRAVSELVERYRAGR